MSSDRNIYLHTVPIEQALAEIKARIDRNALLGTESVPTHEAAGRITAQAVYARYSSPTYHSAAMDGIAVKSEHTFAAREGNPVRLALGTGYQPVNTGEPMPAFADAVIMIEHVHQADEQTVHIEAPAHPWQHVRRIGEDIVATELILPQNRTLTPYDIGALLSGGIFEVEVRGKPQMHIIPTGDEVLDFTTRPAPKPGQVIESNSQVLGLLARSWGCDVTRQPPVPDEEQALTRAVQEAMEAGKQIIVIGAGSSAGSKDYTRRIMESLGQVVVHGIAAMPGKPSLLGVSGNTLLVGAPGYPVSSVICFEQLIKPFVAWLSHVKPSSRPVIPVTLTRSVPSRLGQDEFLRLSIGRVDQRWVGTPLPRGAGMITSLTKAQGMAKIPRSSEGHQADQPLNAECLVSLQELEQTLVCVGSHDNTLDLLANELMDQEEPITLASTHVGSLGGLQALKRGTAHLGGAHLYDPQTQDYNFPFLARYLPGVDVQVVNLAIRHQGLIVPKGNPNGITGIWDLAGSDLIFINRQRGAGTRILFDDHLQKANIAADQIHGYDHEEFTHMAVAVNVLSGTADCGMGIYAAAKALDLDFVPLARERYDLIIPTSHLDDVKVQAVLNLLTTAAFQDKIKELGGYETALTGQVMRPGMGLGGE
ncbi:MAG: molybdopterin biosynthesis protein [Desulfovermiculus sp.]